MSPVTFDNPDTVAAFEADFSEAMTAHGLDESHRDIFREHWAMNSHWHGDPAAVEEFARFARMLKNARDPDSYLAAFERARPSAQTPPPATVPPPPTLSDEARALYRKVEDLSFAEKVDFFVAFQKVTGNAEYTPPRPVALPPWETTDSKSQEDRLAQELMRSHSVGYVDAVNLVRHTRELAAARAPSPPTCPGSTPGRSARRLGRGWTRTGSGTRAAPRRRMSR